LFAHGLLEAKHPSMYATISPACSAMQNEFYKPSVNIGRLRTNYIGFWMLLWTKIAVEYAKTKLLKI
jgi:hypothetical protein